MYNLELYKYSVF